MVKFTSLMTYTTPQCQFFVTVQVEKTVVVMELMVCDGVMEFLLFLDVFPSVEPRSKS